MLIVRSVLPLLECNLLCSLGCADFHLQIWIFPPIRHHCFLFYLFALLTLLFSQIWTTFLHVICCFIFPFLRLSSSVIFALLFYLFVIFHSCLHLVCSLFLFAHSHFLCRSTKLFSLYLFSFFIWQQTSLFFSWIIALLSPFVFSSLIPCTFFPTHMIYFLFSVPSLPLKNQWYWKNLWWYINERFSCWWCFIFMGIFHFGGGINFKLILD